MSVTLAAEFQLPIRVLMPVLALFFLFSPALAQTTFQTYNAAPVVTAEECDRTCGLQGHAILSIHTVRSGEEARLTIASPVKRITAVVTNSAGRLIATGVTDDDVNVVILIDPQIKKVLREFWSTNVGVSPTARYIAFTKFVSSHGPDSLYSDVLVYVFDTFSTMPSADGLSFFPSGATAVFPRSLVTDGEGYVMSISPYRLFHVLSNDLRWTSDERFEFFAGKIAPPDTPQSSAVYPIQITLGDDFANGVDHRSTPATAVSAFVGQEISCNRRKIAQWNFEGISAGCSIGAAAH